MWLKIGAIGLDLSRPQVMGVLNVTADSFSDGGRFLDPEEALAHADAMVRDGASIIDVGGESTRPGATGVSVQEELDRVMPIVEAITASHPVAVSVDTSKPEVMRAALRAGAGMINDIFAFRRDGALQAVSESDCAICLMHMLGEPGTMQDSPHYDDVTVDVGRFLTARIEACNNAGIDANRIVVDPGFGFGKTDRHNLQLLAKLGSLQILGRPLLVGLSRKRTLGNLTNRASADRLPVSVAAAVLAVERGATIVRTHDVAATVDALAVVAAVRSAGLENNQADGCGDG